MLSSIKMGSSGSKTKDDLVQSVMQYVLDICSLQQWQQSAGDSVRKYVCAWDRVNNPCLHTFCALQVALRRFNKSTVVLRPARI